MRNASVIGRMAAGLTAAGVVTAGVVTAGLTAAAAGATAGPPEVAGRYGDELTMAMAGVDLERVRVGETIEWLAASLLSDPNAGAWLGVEAQAVDGAKLVAEGLRARLRDAGATEAYAFFSFSDLPEFTPFFVVPTPSAAAARGVFEAMPGVAMRADGMPANGGDGSPLSSLRKAIIGDDVVLGPERVIERLTDGGSASPLRSGAAERLARIAGSEWPAGAHVVLLLAPGADTARVIESMLPALPADLGVGPTTDITRGLRSATLALTTGAAPSLAVRVRSDSPDAARAMEGWIDRAFAAMGDRGEADPPALLGSLRAMAPRAQGAGLERTIPADRMAELFGDFLLPALVESRRTAQNMEASSSARQAALAFHLYLGQHDNRVPDSLETLVDSGIIDRAALRPRPGTELRYLKPKGDIKELDWAKTIIIYEEAVGVDLEFVAVGLLDGSAQVLPAAEAAARIAEQRRR